MNKDKEGGAGDLPKLFEPGAEITFRRLAPGEKAKVRVPGGLVGTLTITSIQYGRSGDVEDRQVAFYREALQAANKEGLPPQPEGDYGIGGVIVKKDD